MGFLPLALLVTHSLTPLSVICWVSGGLWVGECYMPLSSLPSLPSSRQCVMCYATPCLAKYYCTVLCGNAKQSEEDVL